MLGRLLLLLVQVLVCWLSIPYIAEYFPAAGAYDIFVKAACFALIIWLIGLFAALASRDVSRPTPSALFVTLVFALGLAFLSEHEQARQAINEVLDLPSDAYPIIGAVVGYAITR
ncbi:MAG: hypothetical protein ACR2PG_18470 [Hyphomicrobiaceae bacterium]